MLTHLVASSRSRIAGQFAVLAIVSIGSLLSADRAFAQG